MCVIEGRMPHDRRWRMQIAILLQPKLDRGCSGGCPSHPAEVNSNGVNTVPAALGSCRSTQGTASLGLPWPPWPPGVVSEEETEAEDGM